MLDCRSSSACLPQWHCTCRQQAEAERQLSGTTFIIFENQKMYIIKSVKNITDTQWNEYFCMAQELNEKYYPERYNRNNTLDVFKNGINNSYNKITGYENYLIIHDNLPVGWFYLTTWGDVLYIGLYINADEINYDHIKNVFLFVNEIMKNKNYNELFTSSYRNANIDFFKKMDAEITEEFVSSQIKREEINKTLLNSIVNNYDLNGYKTIYCNRIDEEYSASYVDCFNLAFRDLMNLNKVKLKYEPFTKEQLINNQNSGAEKHIILLLNNINKIIGFSELYYDNENSSYSCGSGFTAVHPDYRGRGIAKFLKAKLYIILANKDKDFNCIKTNSLKCNKYINKINAELGFKEYRRGYSFRFTSDLIENYLKQN